MAFSPFGSVTDVLRISVTDVLGSNPLSTGDIVDNKVLFKILVTRRMNKMQSQGRATGLNKSPADNQLSLSGIVRVRLMLST